MKIDNALSNGIKILPDETIDKIIDSVFKLLEETGIKFDKHVQAYDILSSAGCDISPDGIVKFPSELVKECLAQTPESFKWWNRPGTDFVDYGSGKPCFIADSRAPSYIDPFTGERKTADNKAPADIVKLVDSLPELDICGIPVSTNDFFEDNVTTVINTSKPVLLSVGENVEVLKSTVELGKAIRGGIDKLKEKPYFSIIISPEIMHYPLFVIEEIKLCTEYNIPIFMAEMAMGGLSSPATLAGTLIVCLASTFPGIVLSQLFKKGHPCIEASFPTIMDPVTAGVGGFPENAMADSARSQICRKFGLLLSQQTALVTGTTDFDQNCIAQMSWNFGGLITSSFDSFWGAGTLDAGLVYSPHSLVFANELASMARRVWRGIPVDDDSIALDLIKNVDPGMFIMEDHTVVHSRKDIWQGRYIKIKPNDVEKKDISEKIHDDIVNILSSHKGEALSDSILKDIKNIQKK